MLGHSNVKKSTVSGAKTANPQRSQMPANTAKKSGSIANQTNIVQKKGDNISGQNTGKQIGLGAGAVTGGLQGLASGALMGFLPGAIQVVINGANIGADAGEMPKRTREGRNEELYNNEDRPWYKRHADYIDQITSKAEQDNENYTLEQLKQDYLENYSVYQQISEQSDIPPELIAAMHYRENKTDFVDGAFDVYLHNGQELGSPTTIVPVGKDFEKGEFVDAAVDALRGEDDYFVTRRDQLQLTADSTDIIAMTAFGVFFNGTGGSAVNGKTSYGYNGTDIFTGGLYTSDGNYDPNATDRHLGIYPVLDALLDVVPPEDKSEQQN